MPIYGECVGAGASASALISHLGDSSCELEFDGASPLSSPMSGREFALWIGAMGPFAATCIDDDGKGHCHAAFKEPLDERIIEHFRTLAD